MKDFKEAFPDSDSLDDEGCKRLAAAIILQAAADMYDDIKFRMKYPTAPIYRTACDIKCIKEFVYSDWFSSLTDIDPETFIDTVVQWYTKKKDLPGYISRWRVRLLESENDEQQIYYEPSMLHNLLNDPSYSANHKPEEETC